MKVFVAMFLVMLATFVIHEAAHGLAGAALGYDMAVSSNHANPVGGKGAKQHDVLISAAGPAVTVLGAVSVLLSSWRMLAAFQIVLAAFLMRLLASGVSLFNPNDEMRIGVSLGLHPWLLPAAVTSGLLLILLIVAVGVRPGWKSIRLSLLGAATAIALATAGERFLPEFVIPAFR